VPAYPGCPGKVAAKGVSVCLYVCSFVRSFIHLFIVNVMHSEFSKERDKARARGDFKKSRDQRLFDEEYKGYLEWITHAG